MKPLWKKPDKKGSRKRLKRAETEGEIAYSTRYWKFVVFFLKLSSFTVGYSDSLNFLAFFSPIISFLLFLCVCYIVIEVIWITLTRSGCLVHVSEWPCAWPHLKCAAIWSRVGPPPFIGIWSWLLFSLFLTIPCWRSSWSWTREKSIDDVHQSERLFPGRLFTLPKRIEAGMLTEVVNFNSNARRWHTMHWACVESICYFTRVWPDDQRLHCSVFIFLAVVHFTQRMKDVVYASITRVLVVILFQRQRIVNWRSRIERQCAW